MAKELPYFRFTAFEWLNDDISLESYKLKGLFADICAYYWFKDCSLTIAMLEKRFNNAIDMIKELLELDIIKLEEDSEFIKIGFLNKQYDVLSEQRKRRQEAGSKGGKQKSSNAKAKLKQKSSYKDKDKEKDNNKYKFTDFSLLNEDKINEFIKYRNKIKKPFKTERGFNSFQKELFKLSEGKPEKAILIIDQSLDKEWQGIFELKEKFNGKTKKHEPQKDQSTDWSDIKKS